MASGLVRKFSVKALDPESDPLVARARAWLSLPDATAWHDYYVEFERPLTGDEAARLGAALAPDFGSRTTADEPLDPATMVQVAHRAGVVDNESPSVVALCRLLDLPAVAGKMATTYRSASPRLRAAVREQLYNPSIEDLHEQEPAYATLVPAGRYLPAERHDLRGLGPAELAVLGRAGGRNLSGAQMAHIQGIQEALGWDAVTDVLLEALDARWSDHCSHTTWRSHGDLLGRLVEASEATKNPNIVSMFHDNAGVWDFYDGYALAIKGETHNGPSGISAYFGQLTKLGGVLRDILGTGLGADPIGCFEYTATGLPERPAPTAGLPNPRHIAVETIRAIKEYGNTFGVPMMASRMTFHPGYRAKPFALGGSIGLIPRAQAQRGRPQPGDLVVLVGGLTGSEGIHGASASSAGASMDNAAVQIGAPLEQVKFRKAILDLRDAGCLRALTDVGGAGLNSAVGEIGEACGVWMNTAVVPLKTQALPMWRILLSESQERMILAVPPDRLAEARAIAARHDVRATAVGAFAATGRYCVFHDPDVTEDDVVGAAAAGAVPAPGPHGEMGFDVPYDLLRHVPEPVPVGPPPVAAGDATPWPAIDLGADASVFARVVEDSEVASQHYANVQYDSTVQGNTAYGPSYGRLAPVAGAYWAGTPVPGSQAAAVFSTAFDPWLFEAHPVRALRQMFCRLVAGQVLAGVDVADVCLCDNFYTPHLEPHAGAWLVAMVDELAALVRRFGTPVISGKDSSAGSVETDEGLVSVPPAVFLSALGKVPDVAGLLGEEWTGAGNVLVRIGPATPALAATVAARALGVGDGTSAAPGPIDTVALDAFEDYLAALAVHRSAFRSGTPIGPGGVAARLVAGTLAGGLGVEVAGDQRTAEALLAEHRVGALVEVPPDEVGRLPDALGPVVVGTLTAAPGVHVGGADLLTPALRTAWATAFERRIA